MPKVTMQSLIEENTILKARLQGAQTEDEDLRKEFSKALNAPTYKESEYSKTTLRFTYSWFEIFREIGKLLSKENYAEYVDKISRLETVLGQMQNDIFRINDNFRDHRLMCEPNSFARNR